MLTLFYAPGTCSLAAHIVLEEIGTSYEARRIDFSAQQQTSPEFLTLNPKGRVPALVTDRGVITETPAILAFLAQRFPSSDLAPLDDPFDFARLQAFNSYLCSTVHVAHAHGRRGSRWTDDAAAIETMKQKVPQTMAACFDLIETTMLAGPWVMGQAYTVADAYLYTMAGWLEADGVDPAHFPAVLDHRNRMAERPAVRSVLAALSG